MPSVAASATRVDFLCPAKPAGTQMQVVVNTGSASTLPVTVTEYAAAPGIFSLDGSGAGQGAVVRASDARLSTTRNYRNPGQPARAGETVALYATGVSLNSALTVRLGERALPADSVTAAEGQPGVFRIVVTVPSDSVSGIATPLTVEQLSDGIIVVSNKVIIAIEQ